MSRLGPVEISDGRLKKGWFQGNLVNETLFYIIRTLYSIIYSYPHPARAKTASDAPRTKNGMDAIGERESSVASLALWYSNSL